MSELCDKPAMARFKELLSVEGVMSEKTEVKVAHMSMSQLHVLHPLAFMQQYFKLGFTIMNMIANADASEYKAGHDSQEDVQHLLASRKQGSRK